MDRCMLAEVAIGPSIRSCHGVHDASYLRWLRQNMTSVMIRMEHRSDICI